ncbi:MAG: hypothetical protein RMY34_16515 [Aulosira sp. DedQUE10]|nr:hypothetical protein [Aulosira sp. DedQUE10]
MWDVATRECSKILYGHTGMVTGVAFSPDGNTLISGDGYAAIKFLSTQN